MRRRAIGVHNLYVEFFLDALFVVFIHVVGRREEDAATVFGPGPLRDRRGMFGERHGRSVAIQASEPDLALFGFAGGERHPLGVAAERKAIDAVLGVADPASFAAVNAHQIKLVDGRRGCALAVGEKADGAAVARPLRLRFVFFLRGGQLPRGRGTVRWSHEEVGEILSRFPLGNRDGIDDEFFVGRDFSGANGAHFDDVLERHGPLGGGLNPCGQRETEQREKRQQGGPIPAIEISRAADACHLWPSLIAQQTEKRAITFDDLIHMQRVGGAQVSRDGKWVAYTLAAPNMEANRNESNIWMVPTAGGAPLQLTRGGHDSSPQWSPDGKTIAFLSLRDGGSQIYLLSTEGGEPAALTRLSTGADLVKWSPDGKLLAFTSWVYPDCQDDACNSARDAERGKSKVQARIYDHLLFRHWTHWNEGKRSHLFVVAADGGAAPRDLTAGADYDVPPDERGGPEDIAFSPDSKELCFTAVTDKMEAISTNGDLFLVAAAGGEPKRITTNPGFDGKPVYFPDGRFNAYHPHVTPEH